MWSLVLMRLLQFLALLFLVVSASYFLAVFHKLTRTLKLCGKDQKSAEKNATGYQSVLPRSNRVTITSLCVLLGLTSCSMPSMRITLSAETGEATVGDYKLERGNTTYGSGQSDGLAAALAAATLPTPVPSPVLIQP